MGGQEGTCQGLKMAPSLQESLKLSPSLRYLHPETEVDHQLRPPAHQDQSMRETKAAAKLRSTGH